MRFATSFAAVMAFAASALAQTANFDPITKPGKNEKIAAGSNFEITWEPSAKYTGPVTISLIGGKTQDTQVPLSDIATGVTGSSYSWAVKSSLGAENVYGLVIKLESDPKIFQYSFPFEITGGASGDSATGSAKTTITTSHGIKTVTLSSSAPTTTSTSSTSTPATHTKTPNTTTSQTTVTPSPTKVTSTVVVPPNTDTPANTDAATTGPAPTHTNAAAAVGAPMALIGGLAVALFAL